MVRSLPALNIRRQQISADDSPGARARRGSIRPVRSIKKRKRGRPPAGLRAGERTTDYRRLTLRIPARVHAMLERLARDEGLPQWRIVVAALQRYDTTAGERRS